MYLGQVKILSHTKRQFNQNAALSHNLPTKKGRRFQFNQKFPSEMDPIPPIKRRKSRCGPAIREGVAQAPPKMHYGLHLFGGLVVRRYGGSQAASFVLLLLPNVTFN